MGLGAGHVLDMINRMKQNRAQKPSNRSKFKGKNRDSIYSSKNKNELTFKTVSEEELDKIKKQIRKDAKTNQKKEFVIYGLIFISILALILIFFIE